MKHSPFSASWARRRRVWVGLVTAVVAVVMGAVVAGPARAAAPEGCDAWSKVQQHVRADVVAADLTPSGQFVDSRCPGRTLKVSLRSEFHFVVHTGLVDPGLDIRVTYSNADSGVELLSQTAVADEAGVFTTEPVDLTSIGAPGDVLKVVVDDPARTRSIRITAVEYAIILG